MRDCSKIQSAVDRMRAEYIHDALAYGRVTYRIDVDGSVEQVPPSLIGWDDEGDD